MSHFGSAKYVKNDLRKLSNEAKLLNHPRKHTVSQYQNDDVTV